MNNKSHQAQILLSQFHPNAQLALRIRHANILNTHRYSELTFIPCVFPAQIHPGSLFEQLPYGLFKFLGKNRFRQIGLSPCSYGVFNLPGGDLT
jgi:hypothetical protein